MKKTSRTTHQVVAAERGWCVRGQIEPESDVEPVTELWREPIIAWLITVEPRKNDEPLVFTEPITLEGNMSHTGNYLIERPDKTFCAPCEADFVDEAQALKFVNEVWRNGA